MHARVAAAEQISRRRVTFSPRSFGAGFTVSYMFMRDMTRFYFNVAPGTLNLKRRF